MYAASDSFERLSTDDKINYLFKLAFRLSAHTNADEYSPAQFESVRAWADKSLGEFAMRAMGMRHNLHAYDISRPHGLHAAVPETAATGDFSHFQYPGLIFTIDNIKGVDTRGYNLRADRLTVVDSPVMQPGDTSLVLERMNYGAPELLPYRPYRHASTVITDLCVQFETIERTL